jgi:hypothetical protein
MRFFTMRMTGIKHAITYVFSLELLGIGEFDMLRPQIEAAKEIKEIFDLYVFGKPAVLLFEDSERLCISWSDGTMRYARGPYNELVEIAKSSDGSLDRYWEKLKAANLTGPKPR